MSDNSTPSIVDLLTNNKRLGLQLEFILEIDKLKEVMRRNLILEGKRFENSAEHSWTLAIMAFLLAEHANEPVDVCHVVKMVLIHDLVEIDAGDTYCYDEEGNRDKVAREERAADRIFGMLPDDQADEIRALWDEFEAMETNDSKFANAIDRILPLLQNYQGHGISWIKHGVHAKWAQKRMAPTGLGSAELATVVDAIIDSAVANGWLQK